MLSIGKIYARRIYDGAITITDVPMRYRPITREAYLVLYGEECPEV